MEAMKCLIRSMWLELDAADCYYHKAIELSDDFPNLAMVYNEIASQELSHCEKFKQQAISLFEKKEKGDFSREIWEYEHERISDRYDELRYRISKFSV